MPITLKHQFYPALIFVCEECHSDAGMIDDETYWDADEEIYLTPCGICQEDHETIRLILLSQQQQYLEGTPDFLQHITTFTPGKRLRNEHLLFHQLHEPVMALKDQYCDCGCYLFHKIRAYFVQVQYELTPIFIWNCAECEQIHYYGDIHYRWKDADRATAHNNYIKSFWSE